MTIKDIAKLSGVGVSTVSRVLNDRPDVSEESRRRVLQVIAECNYLPNNSARSLVRTKSDAIGLVVRGVQNPFYTGIIRAIERDLDAEGCTMVMRQIGSCEDEIKCGAMMEREKRLQGIIFLGGRSDYTPAETALLNVPFVCCSYTNAYGTLDPTQYSSVSIADEQEAYRAVMDLAQKGHRRIAALSTDPRDCSISQLRCAGYARALHDLGLAPEDGEIICTDDFTIESAYRAVTQRLKRPADFTAIFAISDDMAIGAMRALRESGRSIPEDCSIIAIDGLTVSEYIYPMLTTLCQPTDEMGARSVDILMSVIRGGTHRHLILPTTLRTGQSVRDLNQ
jgi:LacI family transcriptional regulator